jgi:formylmethanofuran dehydrogenase subunit B
MIARSGKVDDFPCLGCSCVCDDLTVVVLTGRLDSARNACDLGRAWLEDSLTALVDDDQLPEATVNGAGVTLDEAIDEAIGFLAQSRAPMIVGLKQAACEAQAEAIGLADRLRAAIGVEDDCVASAKLAATQRRGSSTATWGEIVDRADTIVFWGTDFAETHPRFGERFLFREQGRYFDGPRKLISVCNAASTPTTSWATDHVRIWWGEQASVAHCVRALVKGRRLDKTRVEQETLTPLERMEGLASVLREARYTAIFVGRDAEVDPSVLLVLTELAIELNRDGRHCFLMGFGGSPNAGGESAMLTAIAGAPREVDFGLGYPRHLPDEATLQGRIARKEVDALINVGAPATEVSSPYLQPFVDGLPLLSIGPGATGIPPRPGPHVAINVARLGIDAGGTVCRGDGVMLATRPIIPASRPGLVEVLRQINTRLDRQRGAKR